MKEIGSFQKVIDAVNATGIGLKRFIFRMNMSSDMVMDFEADKRGGEMFPEFPVNKHWDGVLIIKFSDGNSHIGSLSLTREEVNNADVGWYKYEGPVFGFNLHTPDYEIEIEFTFRVYGTTPHNAGDACIEVMPKSEKLKEWFNEGR